MLPYTILHYIMLYYTILHYSILYHIILYCTVPYYTVLYYIILYYTRPYCVILYHIVLPYTTLKSAPAAAKHGLAASRPGSGFRCGCHPSDTSNVQRRPRKSEGSRGQRSLGTFRRSRGHRPPVARIIPSTVVLYDYILHKPFYYILPYLYGQS